MIYIVEVGNLDGVTATKQYEAQSVGEVLRMTEIELRNYPELHVIKVAPLLSQIETPRRAYW